MTEKKVLTTTADSKFFSKDAITTSKAEKKDATATINTETKVYYYH